MTDAVICLKIIKYMKVATSLKTLAKRHPACKIVRRRGVLRVINKEKRRFKARQG